MRHLLVSELKSAGSKRDWGHITTQIGMFSYLGLTKEQASFNLCESISLFTF